MFLHEEYALRKNLSVGVKYVSKGFLFFGEDNRLLVIKWTQPGPHPGDYEISECLLGKRVRVLDHQNVSWNYYEDYILRWVSEHDNFVSNKTKIFHLVWEWFLRRNDKFFADTCDPIEIYSTIEASDTDRVVNSMSFLDKLSKKQPHIFNFWNTKSSEIIAKYSHWLVALKQGEMNNGS